MTKALVWLAFTYSVLKLASILRARNPGFRRTGISWRDRLRAREPALFLVALLISVPLAGLTSCYAHRTLASLYESSTACYGRIVALRKVPLFKDRLDNFTVAELIQGYRSISFKAAEELEMSPEEVDRTLAEKVTFFAGQYARLQGRGMQQELHKWIAASQRCLLPPGAVARE